MPWSIFALLLLAACMHALWNALVKGGKDSLATMTLICAVAALASVVILLLLNNLPARASWNLLAISLLAHLGYKVCLLFAYRYGELGQVYPIARGVAPILLLLITLLVLPLLTFEVAVMLQASLSPAQIVAVLLIALSVISLAFIGKEKRKANQAKQANHQNKHKNASRGFAFACATACFIAAYSMLDAMGARVAQDPIAYVAALMALDFLPIAIVFLYCNRKVGAKNPSLKSSLPNSLQTSLQNTSLQSIWRRLTHRWQLGVVGGLLSLGAYAIVVFAMSRVDIASVVAIRETSIVFAALIGWLFLQERHGAWRLLPALLITIAVVMLKISG